MKIILPTPVFFTYPKLPKVHVRDTAINDFESWRNSETVTSLVRNGGDPTLDHSYTVTSDTLAAIDLAHYLDTVGVVDRVAFEVTGESSMNLLEKANVVALGAYSTLHPFRDYLASMNFSLDPNEAWVENIRPAAGESQRYAVVSQGVGRQVEPAIVAVLPGRGPNLKLLIMQSRHTSALVGMLTSKIGNSLFEKIYKAHIYNTPVSYQEQWNIGIEQQLQSSLVFNLNYAGGHGVKLPISGHPNDLNPKYFGAQGDSAQVAFLQASVANPFFGQLTTGSLAAANVQRVQLLSAFPQYISNTALSNSSLTYNFRGAGSASFNAMQVGLSYRRSNGLSGAVFYTWSKLLGNVSDRTNGFLNTTGNPAIQNYYLIKQ